jgi:pentatricopeptide repeat protein
MMIKLGFAAVSA